MASFARTGRKIVAIGRNYAKHAKELGNAVPEKPFFFLKPTSSYVFNGGNVEIPQGVLVHHEVELGVIIGKTGRDIVAANAEEHIAGYGELSLEGDLLLTGTPEGVGAIQAGDKITAGLQLPDASK
ncbi:6400_t:CDS:2, partial [Acaulospora colombiana]